MTNEEKVINYYVLAAKLKDVIRKGWMNVCVERKRLESVAEHVYSCQNLAIGMYFVYKPNINLEKVILMIAVHEVEEIVIGDIAVSDPEYKHAKDNAHEIVANILSILGDADKIKDLIFEFDARETDEAKFAYLCDKLDCDIQAKIYSEENSFNIETLRKKDNLFTSHIVTGEESLSDVWLPYDKHIYEGNKDFMAVFNYISNNEILSYRKKFESNINK